MAAVSVLVMLPAPASAHDPIIIDDSQTTPASGPLLLDGTISFALYGVLVGGGDTRGFRVRMQDGERLTLQLLVPNLAPETELAESDLPSLEVEAPDGETWLLTPEVRIAFDEPFSRTSYLRLLDNSRPAIGGDYKVTVRGTAPARFTVAVGTLERFGTPVENVVDRDAGVPAVIEWYSTAPGDSGDSDRTTVPGSTAPSGSTQDGDGDALPLAVLGVATLAAMAVAVAAARFRRLRADQVRCK